MPNIRGNGQHRDLTIAFKVEGKPIQQGSMRAFNNRIVHNKTKELMTWRSAVAKAAYEAGCTPINGPIAITMRFFYERGKTVTRQIPTVPPDLDKQIRSILDALTGVAYADDSQVTRIKASKEYGPPGVEIEVTGGFESL